MKHVRVVQSVQFQAAQSLMNPVCLSPVPVPEEHQDLPDGMRRGIWHEEKRAV